MSISILDCTLRDGGYKNNWKFTQEIISQTIKKLSEANVEYIECGYLNEKAEKNINSSIFSSDIEFNNFIFKNNLVDLKSKLLLMINFGEYDKKNLNKIGNNQIYGIRLAFHQEELENLDSYLENITKKGYEVFLQPVQTIYYSEESLEKLVELTNKHNIKYISIVDSFGNASIKQIKYFLELIYSRLDNKESNIGLHFHDNLNLAFGNSKKIVELIKDKNIIFDTTIAGIGRGGGNLSTEKMAFYLNKKINKEFKIDYILDIFDDLIKVNFVKEHNKASFFYFLSAIYGIHPNYVNYLLNMSIKSSDIEGVLPKIKTKNKFIKSEIESLI